MDKLRVVIILGFMLLIFTTNTVNANVDYLKMELPDLTGGLVISADLPNYDNKQLLVSRGEAVYIYNDNQLVSSITDFSGNVTALATGDLTGDYRSEILIGTDRMNFYVYQFRNGQWSQINEFRHLWAPVTYLEVADITGNGWGDVIVLNQRGEAFIYLSWQGNLDIFWRSKPNEELKYIRTADITGNGRKDVVYTYKSSYIGVLSWFDEQFNLISENYPWGSIENLMITDSQDDSLPEIIVTTGQNILYSWRWNGETLGLRSYFSHQMRGLKTIYDQGGIINIDPTTGLTSYNLQQSSLRHRWNISIRGITDVVSFNETFIVKDQNRRFYSLNPISLDILKVFLDNRLLEIAPRMLINQGTLYVSLSDFANLVEGWTILGDNLVLIGDLQVVVEPDKGIIIENNIAIPITDLVIQEEGSVYLSQGALSVLGYEIDFRSKDNEIRMRRHWGWW